MTSEMLQPLSYMNRDGRAKVTCVYNMYNLMISEMLGESQRCEKFKACAAIVPRIIYILIYTII